MGTRNLTCVVVDGDYKIAQYGQWDGYPEGQGITALAFLRDLVARDRVDEFRNKCRALKHLNKTQEEDIWVECGARRGATSVAWDIGQEHSQKYPHLSRDAGAEILQLVLDAEPGIALGSISQELAFAADSVSCEWAYVVDLDAMRLEVFRGFNKTPPDGSGRFDRLELHDDDAGDTKYYPVQLVKSWELSALPDEETFVRESDPNEED